MVVIDLERHKLPWAADGEYLELSDDPESAWHLWVAWLLMGLRDDATSLHYHSWLGDDAASCVCSGTRYALKPAWPPLAAHLVDVWHRRLGLGWFGRLRRYRSVVGRVRTVAGGWANDWYVSAWSLPGAEGADLYRLATGRCDRAYWILYRDAVPWDATKTGAAPSPDPEKERSGERQPGG